MIVFFFLGTLLLGPTSCNRLNEEAMPHKKIPVPEIIRDGEGMNVTLKCPVPHCNHHRKHFKWEIKQCTSDTKIPCNQIQRSLSNSYGASKNDWKRISVKQSQTSCLHNEKISSLEVKMENNVLYRCLINNRTVKIYQLEIADPRILEMTPSDITVPINSQLILQCKVYSSLQPLQIFWFKQCDGCVDHVVYNSTYYTKINTSVDTTAVQKEMNVYVSKLNIYKVGVMDNGVYACVGVNGNSFHVKTAVVKIQSVDNWEPHASFSLLFLIPLVFALVPITIWLCYYKNKQKHVDRAIFQQRKKLVKVNDTHVPV